MTLGAVVQARMSSRRLPGKVLIDLGGRTMLSGNGTSQSKNPLTGVGTSWRPLSSLWGPASDPGYRWDRFSIWEHSATLRELCARRCRLEEPEMTAPAQAANQL